MKNIIFVMTGLLLAGCQAVPSANSGTNAVTSSSTNVDTNPDRCGASAMQQLLGSSASALNLATLPDKTRIITPQTKVTRDYREDRLNIHVNKAGVIERVACG